MVSLQANAQGLSSFTCWRKSRRASRSKESKCSPLMCAQRKMSWGTSESSKCWVQEGATKFWRSTEWPIWLCWNREHLLAKMYMENAQQEGHEGATSTFHRLRRKVWRQRADIFAGNKQNTDWSGRYVYRIEDGTCAWPSGWPLLVFQIVSVDLFGPIVFQGTIKKRQTAEGWGVILLCTAISAIHVEFAESHLTDCFLMTLRRFMCFRAARIQ